jgi:hypothetical protein
VLVFCSNSWCRSVEGGVSFTSMRDYYSLLVLFELLFDFAFRASCGRLSSVFEREISGFLFASRRARARFATSRRRTHATVVLLCLRCDYGCRWLLFDDACDDDERVVERRRRRSDAPLPTKNPAEAWGCATTNRAFASRVASIAFVAHLSPVIDRDDFDRLCMYCVCVMC